LGDAARPAPVILNKARPAGNFPVSIACGRNRVPDPGPRSHFEAEIEGAENKSRIARLFVAEGASVLLADLDADKAKKVDSLGPKARAQHCNVAVTADVRAAVQACVDAFAACWR
jgi:hypothetical protein